MMDFAGRSGIGLLTTPAESHQMLGAEEGSIRVLKSTVERLIREEPTIAIEDAFMLAAHGHNQSVGLSGFSPFQWTRGSASPSENLPLGLDPKKAFDGVLRLKEKARIAFEMESAKSRLSKLNNTISRPQVSYKPGQLVMLRRQKQCPGRVGGSWIGLLHTEGRTLWLATGATIIRARDVQVRPCTRREELNANLEGTAILRMPFTIESLLRSFTGRHFSDVTGDVPSMEQMQSDLSAADVQQEPSAAQPVRSDTWKLHNEDGTSWLIRVHNMPRLALFTPARATTCPFDDASLTGVRQTRLRGIPKGSETVKLEDNYKESDEPNRLMQERWIGETWLEIKPESRPAKTRKSMISQTTTGQKRKSENADRDDVQDDETKDDEVVPDEGLDQQPDDQDRVLPQVPGISPLTTALRDRGTRHLPGGHASPHEDEDGSRFTWSAQYGRMEVDAADVAIESSSSSDSEELVPDVKPGEHGVPPQINSMTATQKDYFYAFEVSITPSDLNFLNANPEKSAIWLSRKMQEKGKEPDGVNYPWIRKRTMTSHKPKS